MTYTDKMLVAAADVLERWYKLPYPREAAKRALDAAMAASQPEHGAGTWAEPYRNDSWYAECKCGGHFISTNRESADAALQRHIASELPGLARHTVRSWAAMWFVATDWRARCNCTAEVTGRTPGAANQALREHFEVVNASA